MSQGDVHTIVIEVGSLIKSLLSSGHDLLLPKELDFGCTWSKDFILDEFNKSYTDWIAFE